MIPRFASLVAVVVFLAARSAAGPRVILVSWDGAGYVMTSRLVAEGRLPNLRRMLREGAWTDGMVSSFPTKTAAAHAVLFTGHYGHTSGITGNELLELPPAEHDRLETVNGYFSTALRVDPLWVRAAREGRRAYAVHATQAFPFATSLRDLTASEREDVFLIHGYTDVQVREETLTERDISLAQPSGWAIPEARGAEARAFAFTVGDSSFWGLFFDDPFDARRGCDTLGVVEDPHATDFVARLKIEDEAGFSTPIHARASGRDVWFSLRLFDVEACGERLLLHRSGAVELALSNPGTPRKGELVMEVYAGNSATASYSAGRFGPTLGQGGDGTAEERFYETLLHLQQQIIDQAKVVLGEDYALAILYSPVTDDVAHELTGFVSPELDGYDAEIAARYWEVIASGFELQDRYLGVLLEAAERDGAHVIVVSDHGMAGTDRLLHLNVALERAGLLAVDDAGEIDLSRTRALALPLGDTSIAVNRTDRLGGIVPPEERRQVLASVRGALNELRDPDSGESVVTAVYEPAASGLLQPGGPSTGDLFLDFAPRYYPTSDTGTGVVIERTAPRGNHVFVPTRRDMLAICAVWGPRIPPGVNWGKIRAIDVVPTVLDLLEIDAPPDLPGTSLVPPRTLLQTGR